MSFAPYLVSLICVSQLVAADASLYDQARELYKQGPARAPEIVRLLREHTKANPQDIEAFGLLGITLFGIEKHAEALPVIDRAIELATEKEDIRPKMVMLRARTLYELNRQWECKRVLEAYWAFWQDSPELKKLYEWYYPRVKDAKEPKEAN
jgi:tetratricopeptide (TPR) repeat protein